MADEVDVDLDWRETRALRAIIRQSEVRLRYITVEHLETVLGVSPADAIKVLARLASLGLVKCHTDADDGCICCASLTQRGEHRFVGVEAAD